MDNKKNLLPNEYFKGLKGKLKTSDLKELEEDMKTLIGLIEDAKEIGQVALAREYEDLGITYLKERILFKSGINQYVYKEDIENYIKSVKKQVVKICEFENFPRTLPKDVIEKVKEVKKLNILDDLWVVFIDYEEKENLTEEEKKERATNRDPILFGTVKENMNRFYFIIDWEDDICDLRFEDMTKALRKLDKKYEIKTIDEDSTTYLNKLIKEREKKSISISEKVKQTWKALVSIWKN